jgi:transposase
MDIKARDIGDPERLADLIGRERNAKQRDRWRVVRLALEGWETLRIAQATGRSRAFVQRWAYAYRDGGLDALQAGKGGGRPPKLPRTQERAFKERLLAGPRPGEEVCTLRGADARAILEKEFGVRYSLNGVYDLLHRLNLSCLSPRPRHRKNDPEALARWLQGAPLLSRTSGSNTPARTWRSGCRTRPASASKGP